MEAKFNPTVKTGKLIFFILAGSFVIYSLIYIYQTSFVIAGQRYFCLFDDGMISLRFAKNLSEGNGLVWNAGGENVEGFTNPLWTIFMAFLHLIPVGQANTSLLVQLSGLVFLLMNAIVVRKLALRLSLGSQFIANLAFFFTAFYLPLNTWGLQGMEVSVLALFTTLSVYWFIQALDQQTFSLRPYLLLGVGTLVRLDVAVIYGGIMLFAFLYQSKNRVKHLAFAIGILAGFLILQTVYRYVLYQDFFPNTYYLKMTGYPLFLRFTRGLYTFAGFLINMNWVLFLFPLMISYSRRNRYSLVLLGITTLQCAYSIFVGGDAWEWIGGANRYISIVMPLFFILFSLTMGEIHKQIRAKKIFAKVYFDRFAKTAIMLTYCLLAAISFNALSEAGWLGPWVLLSPPVFQQENQNYVNRALLLNQISEKDARVGVVWAGILPYFTDRYTIDLLGKNDEVIAHEDMRQTTGLEQYIFFYPGHLKWDYSYSIGQLKPDFILDLWLNLEEVQPYLEQDYTKITIGQYIFYARNDSTKVLWNQISRLQQSNDAVIGQSHQAFVGAIFRVGCALGRPGRASPTF